MVKDLKKENHQVKTTAKQVLSAVSKASPFSMACIKEEESNNACIKEKLL